MAPFVANPQRPLLFLLGELSGEANHVFFDPDRMKPKIFKPLNGILELECQVKCLAARFGWLLLKSRDTNSLFFYKPLTGQKIDLPYRRKFGSFISAAAFSNDPTSPTCTVYLVLGRTGGQKILIDTFNMDSKHRKWAHYALDPTSRVNLIAHAVCTEDELYCVDSLGRVLLFNQKKDSWSFIECARDGVFKRAAGYDMSLVEHNGEIYAGKKGSLGLLEGVYKLELDHGMARWMELEVEDINLTLFFGPYGSFAVEGAERKIYVADDRTVSKIVVYDLGDGKPKVDSKFPGPAEYGCCHTPIWIQRDSE